MKKWMSWKKLEVLEVLLRYTFSTWSSDKRAKKEGVVEERQHDQVLSYIYLYRTYIICIHPLFVVEKRRRKDRLPPTRHDQVLSGI